MATEGPAPVTDLLLAWRAGEVGAFDRLLTVLYDELRALADRQLRRERGGHGLRPTALVSDAYLRLLDADAIDWQDRSHFYAVAATVMRRVLVDHARRRRAEKRGGEHTHLALDEALDAAREKGVEILALETALADLERLDPRQARVVELRYYGGMTAEEIGVALDVSTATVKRDWATARVWLHDQMAADP